MKIQCQTAIVLGQFTVQCKKNEGHVGNHTSMVSWKGPPKPKPNLHDEWEVRNPMA